MIGDFSRTGESGGVTSVLEEEEGVALFAFPFPFTGPLIFLFFLFSTGAFPFPLLDAPLYGAGGTGWETGGMPCGAATGGGADTRVDGPGALTHPLLNRLPR